MFEFLTPLFDTTGFPARWNCGNWTPGHGWLHIKAITLRGCAGSRDRFLKQTVTRAWTSVQEEEAIPSRPRARVIRPRQSLTTLRQSVD